MKLKSSYQCAGYIFHQFKYLNSGKYHFGKFKFDLEVEIMEHQVTDSGTVLTWFIENEIEIISSIR